MKKEPGSSARMEGQGCGEDPCQAGGAPEGGKTGKPSTSSSGEGGEGPITEGLGKGDTCYWCTAGGRHLLLVYSWRETPVIGVQLEGDTCYWCTAGVDTVHHSLLTGVTL